MMNIIHVPEDCIAKIEFHNNTVIVSIEKKETEIQSFGKRIKKRFGKTVNKDERK